MTDSDSVVVMVTMADRVEMLNTFMQSLVDHEPGRPIMIHVQGDYDAWRERVRFPRQLETLYLMTTNRPLGCHAARVDLLQASKASGHNFDTLINVDDDVVLTEHTDWQPAANVAHAPGVGFVLTNWCMHWSQYEKRKAQIAPKLQPQVLVYNGGGMAYSDETAELIRALDPVPARYDDLWPITAYLDGRMNYRYGGSLSVHLIRSAGGMSSYMAAEPRPLLCWPWIDYKKISGARVGRDYAIGMDADLRPAAHEAFVEARKRHGWPMRNDRYAAHPKIEDYR